MGHRTVFEHILEASTGGRREQRPGVVGVRERVGLAQVKVARAATCHIDHSVPVAQLDTVRHGNQVVGSEGAQPVAQHLGA